MKRLSAHIVLAALSIHLLACGTMNGNTQSVSSDLFAISVPADWKVEGNNKGNELEFDGSKDSKIVAYSPDEQPYSPPLLIMEYIMIGEAASPSQIISFTEKQKHESLREKLERDNRLQTMIKESKWHSTLAMKQLPQNIYEESIDIEIPVSPKSGGFFLKYLSFYTPV